MVQAHSIRKKILIVDDSSAYSKVLDYSIVKKIGMECDIASDFSMAKKLISKNKNNYFLAISDLNLPDCKAGDSVDYILSKQISCIVITGDFDEKIRKNLINKSILDYVVKKDRSTLPYIIELIEKIISNQRKKILLVDDSQLTRFMIGNLLRAHKFQVFETSNGKEALDVLKKNKGIDLIITDYNMPEMDGYELVSIVRENYKKGDLAIIGISAQGSDVMSAKFLKKGANDFLTKPFSFEEFYQRINQNIEILDYIKTLKNITIKDYLTGLYNRSFFFDEGKNIYDDSISEGKCVSIAMIDIDFFKKINNEYGHDAGDKVICELAEILKKHVPECTISSRFSGDEFCVIYINSNFKRVLSSFEQLRKDIESIDLYHKSKIIKFTVSIGLVIKAERTFEDSIVEADKLLYSAKNSGRNKIIIDKT